MVKAVTVVARCLVCLLSGEPLSVETVLEEWKKRDDGFLGEEVALH